MKKFLIIVPILFLSGCTVDYNLEIKDNNIRENIKGNILKNEFDSIDDLNGDHTIYSLLYDDQTALVDENSLYDKKIREKNNLIKFDYSYVYNNNFDKSRLLNDCYEDVLFDETDEFYIIKLSGNFYCGFTDNITVNLITDNIVLKNNADKVKGNKYTWYLTPNDTDIEINLYKKRVSKSKGLTNFRIVGLIILIALSIVVYLLHRKKNMN